MTPTNAKITIGSRTQPFVDALQLQVGQAVTVTATAAGGGSLIMHINSRGRKPTAVWDETGPDYSVAWTVDAPAGDVDLVLEHSKHGATLGEMITAKAKIIATAVATPAPAPPKPVVAAAQPAPKLPADDLDDATPEPKLKRTMKLGMIDASKQPLDVSRGVIEPLRLDSIGVWCGGDDIAHYRRDPSVANAIDFAVRLGVDVLWRAVPDHMSAAKAKAGAVQWHLAHARDLFAIYAASPQLAGRKLVYQIGNEPDNGTDYYADGVQSYVRDYLTPVATALRAEFGERILLIAAGFSWDAAKLESVADDIAAVCDAFAFHGYPLGVNKDSMASTKAAVATAHSRGRLLFVTEANLGHGKALKKLVAGDKAGRAALMKRWAADVGPYLIALEDLGVDGAWYFLGYDAGTTASPAAAVNATKVDGRTTIINTPFGVALKAVCAP